MKTIAPFFFRLLLAAILFGSLAACSSSPAAWHRPELEYLKAVNSAGPPRDPEILLLLMSQYANANKHLEGSEFFSTLLKNFEPRLTDREKSIYLAAIGLLRAGHAKEVFVLKRIGWINETIEILKEAERLSAGQVFVVTWMAGVVYAQLPGFFNQREAALADLTWCVENVDKAPHAGWLREVYYQLANLHSADGDKARNYLRLSGYADFEKPVTLATPYAEDPAAGHTFSPKRIVEIVPDKVYALSGFEFTEYYFVVSEDGRELIGIDAGTRPDSAKAAYETLREYAPGLPVLTTILITHAHWDHVGGHEYFRGLNPRPRFYARSNYHGEIALGLNGPEPMSKEFFGTRFSLEDIAGFSPDIAIDRESEISVGGTRIELVPVQGGETDDALFIYLPNHRVMFAGDFIMPYLGAPFIEEGNLEGLLDAIDVVSKRNPQHLLHGHDPLTRLFSSPAMLGELKTYLIWLREQVLASIRQGVERAAIQQANLMPPGLLTGDPSAHIPYMVMRENVINRIYDQKVGYWQPDLQGMDYVSQADRGSILVDYLGVSERDLVEATERMIAEGKHELAATAIGWTQSRFAGRKSFDKIERLTYLKLMEKYQDINPFKFIIYSGRIGFETPQMESKKERQSK